MHQATELVTQFFLSLCALGWFTKRIKLLNYCVTNKDPAGNSFPSHQVTELVLIIFSSQAESFSFI